MNNQLNNQIKTTKVQQINIFFSTTGDESSDVGGFLVSLNNQNIKLLQSFAVQALALTDNFSDDAPIASLSYRFPIKEGFDVFAVNANFEDDFADRISEVDGFQILDVSSDELFDIQDGYQPEWRLGNFRLDFYDYRPVIRSDYEEIYAFEETELLELADIADLFRD